MQEYPYERLLRDARINLIFEGTNEILRCFIALSGMQGPGRELVEVARAMREPIKGFGLLSDFAIRKARTALGRERMTRAHPLLEPRGASSSRSTRPELAQNVDKVLRKHGKNIAEMQYTQKRVADMAIDLYAHRGVHRADDARHREARRGGGAARDRPDDDLRGRGREAARARTSAAFDKNDDELRKAIASQGVRRRRISVRRGVGPLLASLAAPLPASPRLRGEVAGHA